MPRKERSKIPNEKAWSSLFMALSLLVSFSSSSSLSKFAVAERALSVLRDPISEKHVERVCICGNTMQVEQSDPTPSDIENDYEVLAFL